MIVTFYSYKGGTGRSMALANVAALLAVRSRNMLLVDFDLEAPGLAKFFQDYSPEIHERAGLVELLMAVTETGNEVPDWREYVTPIRLPTASLSIITCGRQDEAYAEKVLSFDWDNFFAQGRGAEFIERLRKEWNEEFDFVFVDSRTGITDTGGVCTISLPDLIVALFTANHQSVDGLIDVLHRVQTGRQNLSFDRPPAAVLPLPSRIDTRTELETAMVWLDVFAERFSEFYADWLPVDLRPRQLIERTKLPYVAYFSFGEQLPAITHGTSDPDSLGYALNTVAGLIESELATARRIIEVPGGGPAPAITPRQLAQREHEAARDVWNTQSLWSRTANRIQASIQRWRALSLAALIGSAVFAMLAATTTVISPVATSAAAAVAAVLLALVPVLRSRSSGPSTRDWTQARFVSEALKSEVYLYLAGVGKYSGSDRRDRLMESADLVLGDARNLLPYTIGVEHKARETPDITDYDSYFEVRARPQMDFYRGYASGLRRQSQRFRVIELGLVLTGVLLGALAVAFLSAAASGWIAVATTAVGAVAAHVAASRYDTQIVVCLRTADELSRLTSAAGRTTTPAGLADLVIRAETVIAVHNEGWAAANLLVAPEADPAD